MIAAKIFFITFIIPFLISLVFQFLASKSDKPVYKVTNILGTIFGCFAGYVAVMGTPSLPPLNLNQSLFYQFTIIGLVSVLSIYLNKTYQQLLLKLAGLMGISYLTMKPLIEGLGINKALIFAVIICLSGIIYDSILVRNYNKEKSIVIPIYLFVLTLITSIITFMSGSALIAEFAGIISTSLAAGLAIKIIRKDYSFAESSIFFYISFLLIFWFMGYYLLEIPIITIALLFISPLVFLINFIDKVQSLKRWKAVALNILLFSIPIAIAAFKTVSVYLSKDSYY